MTASRASALQETFAKTGLTGVFVDQLGWDAPAGKQEMVEVGGSSIGAKVIASLKGFRIYAVPVAERPTRQFMRRVDAALAQLSPERMEVFQSPEAWFWHWPRRTSNGSTVFEAVPTSPGTLPLFLAQRLSGLEFTVQQIHTGVTIVDVRDRVHGHFDASPVTKKFYDRFQKEQKALSSAIEGLPAEEALNYSTTLMNRLMFIYFMQKKEFLNDDPRYLENTLSAVRELRGPDQYYSFYRDGLLPLFFDRLNDRIGTVADPEIDRVLGDVPYVNGGIFGRTDLEVEFASDLQVPDSAFEKVLSFFAEFDWHLDTRPTGNDNEINPEVIGYIFEQYINFTSSGKKENGAYYTPHDVTAYMVAQTLVPRILDELGDLDAALALLRADPDRYIQPAMLHGWDAELSIWVSVSDDLWTCWEGDPIEWSMLDSAEPDTRVNLPGETWVETFHRRERVESIRRQIGDGDVREVNDLITENLNGQLLLTDAIDQLDDAASVRRLFDQVTQLSVFDPTCGSGAFLFAALEVLEDVYAHLIDEARTMAGVPEADEIVHQVDQQPSQRYFIRKHIAIRNLYGTDLMPGAIETAKLRIFLALAACVDTRAELRPLPDLDFNLKVGNLVVGFKDAEDAENRLGVDFVNKSYLDGLAPRIRQHANLFSRFANTVESEGDAEGSLKIALKESQEELRETCNGIYAAIAGVADTERAVWEQEARPFHWFCEFPGVIDGGGFDVVIGNPPYVKIGQVPSYSLTGYESRSGSDFYAVCYERSLSLTSSEGRHSLIVMLNLAFSDRFGALRRYISERHASEWWSTYGKWPTQLFAGVRVANTLLVLGPGERKFTTRHNIFGGEHRINLFQTVEYNEFVRDGSDLPVRGGIAEDLLRQLDSLALPAGTSRDEQLCIRPTGQYWFPVLFGVPPILDAAGHVLSDHDHGVKMVRLSTEEDPLLVGAALAGKLSFAWWSATGDDFHINEDEAELGRKAAFHARESKQLTRLAEEVRDAGRRAAFVSQNNDGYVNVRWTSVRDVTDHFDRALLDSLGLIEHWRPLNIWYRQCMRSTRANNNSRLLTNEETEKYLRW